MLGRLRMSVEEARECYASLAKEVFSEVKRWGDGKFKASRLEAVLKSIIKRKTGDEDSTMMATGIDTCKTCVILELKSLSSPLTQYLIQLCLCHVRYQRR